MTVAKEKMMKPGAKLAFNNEDFRHNEIHLKYADEATLKWLQ